MSHEAPPPTVGLALSGGGFRAAFFHVGVLARLAELGLLERVKVISTVSGGSIVGALYYVMLVRQPREGEFTGPDYPAVVHAVEDRLLKAVQANLRALVFINPWKNLKMMLPGYSRSTRIGEVYDRYVYRPAWGKRPRGRWGRRKRIELRELALDGSPDLLLNATCLNTGHNWRFDTRGMGEPANASPTLDVDNNMRLAYVPFEHRDMSERNRAFPLGVAVAASACVPGVFHPLPVNRMYGGLRVQLVDGGVQDNQGIYGLLERGCDHFIVSDASRQMDDADRPSTRLPGVSSRSLKISSSRLRANQLSYLQTRHPDTTAVMHLRKGLGSKVLIPGESSDQVRSPAGNPYGINQRVQQYLSRMRTDLDYMSEYEAYSLARTGYAMADREVQSVDRFGPLMSPATLPSGKSWEFMRVDKLVAQEPSASYRRHLRAGSHRFMRPFFTLPLWARGVVLMLLVVLVGLAVEYGGSDISIPSLGEWNGAAVLGVAVAIGAIALLYVKPIGGVLGRVPIDFIFGIVVPFVAAGPLFLWSSAQLAANALMVRAGRAPRPDRTHDATASGQSSAETASP